MPAADGSIIINTQVDDKDAEKKLANLNKKIKSISSNLEMMREMRLPLVEDAKKLGATLDEAKAKLAAMQDGGAFYTTTQIKAQSDLVRSLQKDWEKATDHVTKYDGKIRAAEKNLNAVTEEAGELQERMTSAAYKSGQALGEMNKRSEEFFQKLKTTARRVLVFSLFTAGLRSAKQWLSTTIQTNDEATAAIGRLKGSLLTLVQPLVNVIIPAFTAFVNILTDITATLAKIMSLLFGTTIEQSAEAAENLNKEAEALTNVGDSAKSASKALASFDEINRLANETSTASSAAGTISPNFEELKNGILSNLTFSLDDILFEWNDLTVEDILAKITTGLSAIAGAVIGFSVGGPGGAAIGLLIGTGVGLVISNLMFNGDGTLDQEELLKSVAFALGTLAGGILGFSAGGGVFGAALGLTIGAGVALSLMGLAFNNDGVLNAEEVLSTVIVALGSLVGGIIGFFLGGGVGGAKIGATIGTGITLGIVGLLFDGDGQLSKEEIEASLAAALAAVTGAILGFAVGGPGGAIIGATVGAGITAKILDMEFKKGNTQAANKILGGLVECLAGLASTLIGFAVGGPAGAVIGATVGVGLMLLIDKAFFSDSDSTQKVAYEEGEEIGDSIISGTNDSLGIHSPSTEYREAGGYMMQGLANGISENSNLPVDAMQGTLALMRTEFDAWTDNVRGGLSDFSAESSSVWSNLWSSANVRFVEIWNNIIANFQTGINNAVSALNKLVAEANELSGLTGEKYSYANRININKLPIPRLAQGAVIPPNREFMAVLGDQTNGRNLEAPEDLIRQIVREESGSGNSQMVFLLQEMLEVIKSGQQIVIDKDGQRVIGKVAQKYINNQSRATGTVTVK